ncbi:X-linked retinitis pigmentosa GTPase regulator isoform X1 [Bemisia tabaci]|uniref:X-linked retinitis pigmentosa GTPase regulator isoform X1 n=1 Tax=Bemisia tabaci TaxID=7038 RepID=UPI003B28081B
MAKEDEFEIPDFGAVFTFGKSRFADNVPSHFFIRNDPIVEISCGDEHTAVVCQKGRVFVFGSNNWGQLGLGHEDTINKPSCVKSLKSEKVEHVSCGRAHTIFSTESNKIFACGSNNDCQLGTELTNGSDHSVIPVQTTQLSEKIRLLTAGSQHSAALTESGKVYIWGSNTEGQCGLGQTPSIIAAPTLLTIKNSIITHVSCGYYHTAFVTEEGKLFICGEGENGKLGLGDDIVNQVYPLLVDIDAFIIHVACGGSYTIALSDNGQVYVFGKNQNKELGLPDLQTVTKPMPLAFDHTKKIKRVSCGERHTGFVTDNGELWMCGDNRHGELCVDWIGDKASPISRISIFSAFFVKDVVCGGCHTMVFASPQTDENENSDPDVMIEATKVTKQENSKTQLPPLQRLPQNFAEEEKNTVKDDLESKDEKSQTGIYIPLTGDVESRENGGETGKTYHHENGTRNGETEFPIKIPQKGNWCSNDTGIEIDEENSITVESEIKVDPIRSEIEELNDESNFKIDRSNVTTGASIMTKQSGLSRFFNQLRNKKPPPIQSEKNITTATVLGRHRNGNQQERRKIDDMKFRNNRTKSKACTIF